jgi:alpha-beta hydrolase superfamily lysophospholipase
LRFVEDGAASVSCMRKGVLFGILLAAVCAAPASAKVPKGPAGTAFYTYTKKLPSKHGTALWQRKLSGQAALKGASSTLLLYSSTGLDGKPVPVSAVLSVPKGKAPKGGRPIVSWAHGTTGIADQCAPSRSNLQQGYDHPLMERWIKAGYAVVRTDYQGLGTAGPHPYLNGDAEGHDVLDAVTAARQADGDIANAVAISGHSQGGQAALFAAALAPKYARSLKVKGTVAFAPVSHLAEQGAVLRSLDTTGLTALAAMIVRGIDIAEPQLNVPSLLSPQAAALYPQIDVKCLPDLGKPDSFGALPTSALFRSDANLDAVIAALGSDDDPEDLTIKTPVQIEQGTADTTVFPAFTEPTAKALGATYKTYAGLTHPTVVTSAKPQADATAFLKKRLG